MISKEEMYDFASQIAGITESDLEAYKCGGKTRKVHKMQYGDVTRHRLQVDSSNSSIYMPKPAAGSWQYANSRIHGNKNEPDYYTGGNGEHVSLDRAGNITVQYKDGSKRYYKTTDKNYKQARDAFNKNYQQGLNIYNSTIRATNNSTQYE